MFMNEDEFDPDVGSSPGFDYKHAFPSPDSKTQNGFGADRPPTGKSFSRGYNDDNDHDDLPSFRTSADAPGNSRARMLAQQREIAMKKRQASMNTSGMVRSSMEGSLGGASPMRQSVDNSQFTSAVPQFSVPKRSAQDHSMDASPEKESEFSRKNRKDEYTTAGRPSTANKENRKDRRNKFNDDDEDLEEEERRAQAIRERQRQREQKDREINRDGDRYGGSRSNDRNNDKGGDREERGERASRRSGGHGNSRAAARFGADDDEDYVGSHNGYNDRNNTGDRSSYERGLDSRNNAGVRGGLGDRDRDNDRYRGRDDEYDRDKVWNGARGGNLNGDNLRESRDNNPASAVAAIPPSHSSSSANTPTAQPLAIASAPPRNLGSGSPAVIPPDLSDMRRFLTTPIPRACGIIQCSIRRNKSGTNKLFPVYELHLKDGDHFLMSSRKRPKNKTSNYLISMDQHDLNRTGRGYLGKLRSNFMGTEFQIFDHGVNPRDTDADETNFANGAVRCELGSVMYAANVLGSRGPRKMQVALPGLDENGNIIKWKDSGNGGDGGEGGDDILTRMKDRNLRDLFYLINKPPRWNEQVGAYVLNFNGRVTMASVKNFQLVDPDEQNAVVLQFGRVGKDDFTMDMQYPISPLQAFAVTLSSFDSKIACD